MDAELCSRCVAPVHESASIAHNAPAPQTCVPHSLSDATVLRVHRCYVEEIHFEKGQVILARGHVPEGLHLLEYGTLAEVNLSEDEIEAGARWEDNILAIKAVSGYYYGIDLSVANSAYIVTQGLCETVA
eukprot:5760915-Amphidinium_carterae.1